MTYCTIDTPAGTVRLTGAPAVTMVPATMTTPALPLLAMPAPMPQPVPEAPRELVFTNRGRPLSYFRPCITEVGKRYADRWGDGA